MNNDKLTQLAELAKAATPGPWHSPGLGEVHDDANNCVIVDVCWREEHDDGTLIDLDSSVGNGTQADADFIAAANPQVVLSLLERIKELERQNGELRDALKCLATEEYRDDDDPVLAKARAKAMVALASSQEQKGGA